PTIALSLHDALPILLAEWFERINETEQLLISLERAAKYDKLGLNKAILQLETAMDRRRVVDAEQMLPLLDRVSKNESYINMARQDRKSTRLNSSHDQ